MLKFIVTGENIEIGTDMIVITYDNIGLVTEVGHISNSVKISYLDRGYDYEDIGDIKGIINRFSIMDVLFSDEEYECYIRDEDDKQAILNVINRGRKSIETYINRSDTAERCFYYGKVYETKSHVYNISTPDIQSIIEDVIEEKHVTKDEDNLFNDDESDRIDAALHPLSNLKPPIKSSDELTQLGENLTNTFKSDIDYKDVSGKPLLGLIHPIALESLGKVATYGVNKYGYENRCSYMNGEVSTYIHAFLRHWCSYTGGNKYDEESGLEHLHQAFFNLYVIIYLESIGRKGDNVWL